MGLLRNLAILVVSVFSLSIGEVMLKVGMDRIERLQPQGLVASVKAFGACPPIWVGFVLMVVQFAGMMELFRYWDVSVVVPVFGINFAITAVIGMVWLKEPVTVMRWLGVLAIMLGVVLIARSGKVGQ